MVNGGDWDANRSFGKSAIIGVKVCSLRFLQTRHSVSKLRSIWRNLRTAKRCCTWDLRNSSPWWWSHLCKFSSIKGTTGCKPSKIIGCFVSNSNASIRSVRPVELGSPPGSTKGENDRIRLVLAIDFSLNKHLSSSLNDSLCERRSTFSSAKLFSTESVIFRLSRKSSGIGISWIVGCTYVSSISLTRFAMKISFSKEFNQCSTVVLSVHK